MKKLNEINKAIQTKCKILLNNEDLSKDITDIQLIEFRKRVRIIGGGESSSWRSSMRLFVDGEEKAKHLTSSETSIFEIFARFFLKRDILTSEWKAILSGQSFLDFAKINGFELNTYSKDIFWRRQK